VVAPAAAAAEPPCPSWVVPPGQEAVLRKMLDVPAGLPGPAAVTSGNVTVDRNVVSASFSIAPCGAGKATVVYQLKHRGSDGPGPLVTESFVVSRDPGKPTGCGEEVENILLPVLDQALVRQIRSAESGFRWMCARPRPGMQVPPGAKAGQKKSGVTGALPGDAEEWAWWLVPAAGVLALLVLGGLGFLLWRRRRARRAGAAAAPPRAEGPAAVPVAAAAEAAGAQAGTGDAPATDASLPGAEAGDPVPAGEPSAVDAKGGGAAPEASGAPGTEGPQPEGTDPAPALDPAAAEAGAVASPAAGGESVPSQPVGE
jgi:hypothetical protein